MLPFTADVLFSSFEHYNRGLWPLPVHTGLLALAAVLATLLPVRFGDRAIAAALTAAWLWTGYGYHYMQFATINFVAPVYAVLFLLQGLLLAWTGLVRHQLAFRFRGDVVHWIGLTLALAAVAVLPLADGLINSWPGARLVGLAPGPSAIFTLGLLLLDEGRTPPHLAVIPVLWSLVAGATGWVLPLPQDLALAAAGLGAFGLILWKNRRHPG